GASALSFRRDDRGALCDAGRRLRARARGHHRLRARTHPVRRADRLVPVGAAPRGGLLDRPPGDALGGLARSAAARRRAGRDARHRGREVLGGGRRLAHRERRAAPARRHGRRRRLPGPPLLPLVEGARAVARQCDPASRAARPRARAVPTPGARMKTRSYESVAVGDALPELPIPITVTLVVGGALASRAYTPLPHDRAAAQAQGMSDVFMNILTTNGLVGRYVTDWAGPDAVVRNVAI